jgi:hypothetical protein
MLNFAKKTSQTSPVGQKNLLEGLQDGRFLKNKCFLHHRFSVRPSFYEGHLFDSFIIPCIFVVKLHVRISKKISIIYDQSSFLFKELCKKRDQYFYDDSLRRLPHGGRQEAVFAAEIFYR